MVQHVMIKSGCGNHCVVEMQLEDMCPVYRLIPKHVLPFARCHASSDIFVHDSWAISCIIAEFIGVVGVLVSQAEVPFMWALFGDQCFLKHVTTPCGDRCNGQGVFPCFWC